MPRPVVPTFAPPRRVSFARSRATWYGMITCALRLTRTRADVDAPRGQGVELLDQRDGVDHDAIADDRGDVRVQDTRRRQPELEDLIAADDRVTGVVATLVANDHRRLLGQEIGRLALALVAPLQARRSRSPASGVPGEREAMPRGRRRPVDGCQSERGGLGPALQARSLISWRGGDGGSIPAAYRAPTAARPGRRPADPSPRRRPAIVMTTAHAGLVLLVGPPGHRSRLASTGDARHRSAGAHGRGSLRPRLPRGTRVHRHIRACLTRDPRRPSLLRLTVGACTAGDRRLGHHRGPVLAAREGRRADRRG